ncbi:stationary phase survival protein SurE [Nautilia lithotrophica]
MYKKYLRPDISFKILSNYPFYSADIEEDFEKFKQKLSEYDVGVFVNGQWKMENGKLNDENIKFFNSLGEELSWEDLVLNYMKSLNTFMREQIGVCINKNIPRTIDNELTYLIIQRKDKKEFSDMFFIAIDGEVIFPMINKEFDINLALIKLAEWKNRANLKNLIKFHN